MAAKKPLIDTEQLRCQSNHDESVSLTHSTLDHKPINFPATHELSAANTHALENAHNHVARNLLTSA